MSDPPRRVRLLQTAFLLAVFLPSLVEWFRQGTRVSRVGYALLVPILAIALAAFAPLRPDWRSGPARGRALGTAGLFAAAALLALGNLSGIFTVSFLAFPLAVVALLVCWEGMRVVRGHAWACALLFLSVPMPLPILDRFNPRMVLLSGRTAEVMLAGFDPEVAWFGTTLSFRGWELVVADACSGSGTLLTLCVLAVFLAGLLRPGPVSSLLVFLVALPLALLVNGLRIATSALCLDLFGPAAASGLPHEILGQGLVLASSLALVGLAAWMSRRRPAPEAVR